MWAQNARASGFSNWAGAISYCDGLELAGYDDWRLPSVNKDGGIAELDTLFRAGGDPGGAWEGASAPFTGVDTGNVYVSITESIADPSSAWYVGFDNGRVLYYSKGYAFYIAWPVREADNSSQSSPSSSSPSSSSPSSSSSSSPSSSSPSSSSPSSSSSSSPSSSSSSSPSSSSSSSPSSSSSSSPSSSSSSSPSSSSSSSPSSSSSSSPSSSSSSSHSSSSSSSSSPSSSSSSSSSPSSSSSISSSSSSSPSSSSSFSSSNLSSVNSSSSSSTEHHLNPPHDLSFVADPINRKITISWEWDNGSHPITTPTGFAIERKIGMGSWELLSYSIPPADRSYEDILSDANAALVFAYGNQLSYRIKAYFVE